MAYGVGKKKGCQWMQIWFSCLYDSDLRKIDAQIRYNKSSLGIFCPGEKEDYMEVRKEDQRDPDEKVVEIEIERLRDFKNHPFKVQADSQMKGLQQLIKTIGRVKKQLNPKLQIEGILLTMVDYRTNYARDISLMVYDTYSASIKVFGSEIPMSVRAAEVSVEGKSIYSYDPKGKVACAYKSLTEEVLKEDR